MIITIPTQTGPFSFCLNASMIKLLALITGLVAIIAGYAVVQLVSFILACTPSQFFHIVICSVCVALPVLTWCYLRKQVHV